MALCICESVEEYYFLKKGQQYIYFCRNCGVECSAIRRTDKIRIEKQILFLCRACLTKNTSLKKYGTESPNQAKVVKEKIKESNLKNFGVNNVFQLENIKEKSKRTCIEKYGTEYANQNEDVKKKIKDTNLKRYGVENTFQAEQFKEKSRETCRKKYGTDWYASTESCKERLKEKSLKNFGVEYTLQSKEVQEKGKETSRRKYGKDYYNQTDEHRKRYVDTCLKKYGEISYTKTKDYQKNARRKYRFMDETFDSSWEVYFFYNCIKFGKSISRNLKKLEYIVNGKKYDYFPDFNVDGQLYEIKGDQFFKEDGTMQNPYNHKLDKLYEAKHQCGLENGVIFLRKVDIIPMKKIFNQDFGRNYINTLRIKKNN